MTPADHAGEHAQRLETTLAAMVLAHEQLLDLTGQHRSAIARADAPAVQACARRQADLAHRIAALESDRRAIVRALAPGQERTTLTSLATHLPESSRPRIAGLGMRLRELLLKIQAENRVIRSATHALIGHMDGLMQQVARALSQAGLYSAQGRLDHASPAPCGLDLRH